jgi:Fe-S-cluster-containing hydrogenase component 2
MSFRVDQELCIGCGGCLRGCPTGALRVIKRRVVVVARACIDCWLCAEVCPTDAVLPEGVA